MTKIRKYNGEILNYKGNYNGEITIKKHTPVRRPMSANWLAVESGTGTVGLVVQDISKGLENPLYVGSDFMEAIRNPKITSTYPERIPGTKPSLLTRVKKARIDELNELNYQIAKNSWHKENAYKMYPYILDRIAELEKDNK